MTLALTPIIYISAIEPGANSHFIFNEQIRELLGRLEREGFKLFWEKEWRDYEIIEREIAVCDALLAIVDDGWTSSTWMASEVTWANGEGGAISTPNPRMQPIPIFLYPVIEKDRWGWLRNYPGPIVLERDVTAAMSQVINMLRK